MGKLGAFGTHTPSAERPWLATTHNSRKLFFAAINFSGDIFGIFLPLFGTEDAFRRPLTIHPSHPIHSNTLATAIFSHLLSDINYIHNIKLKLCAKRVLAVRESF